MKGPACTLQVASTQIIPGAPPLTMALSPDVQEEHTPNLVHFLTQYTKSPESFSQATHPVEPPLLTAPPNLMAGQHPHMTVGGVPEGQ